MTHDGLLAAGPGFEWADPYAAGLLVVGLAVFAAIGALSHQDDRAFSASLIYLGVGLVAAAVIGVAGIEWLVPRQDAELIERLSELAVVIALFSTGLKLDRSLRPRAWGTVARLLAITMPLTIAAVALYGAWAMGLPLAAAILVALPLAATAQAQFSINNPLVKPQPRSLATAPTDAKEAPRVPVARAVPDGGGSPPWPVRRVSSSS